MMLKKFKEAHAAVMNRAERKVLEEYAVTLTEHALFPIRDCFYPYTDREMVHPKETIVSPDQAGVLQTINDLFVRQPERFGDDANRAEIKRRTGVFFAAYQTKKLEIFDNHNPDHFTSPHLKAEKRAITGNLFADIADVFRALCPDALCDVSIALVGIDSPSYLEEYANQTRAVFTPNNVELLSLFREVYDFYPERNHGTFTLDAVDTKHADVKVDYVVTGNVLNDPAHYASGQMVFLAAARMLKQGGRAYHLVGYSNHYYELHIDNPALAVLAGQKRVANQPTLHHPLGYQETRVGCQDFVVFEQMRAIDLTPRMVATIIDDGITITTHRARHAPHVTPYIDPFAPQAPAKLARMMALAGVTHS